jgi:hypothetical protein
MHREAFSYRCACWIDLNRGWADGKVELDCWLIDWLKEKNGVGRRYFPSRHADSVLFNLSVPKDGILALTPSKFEQAKSLRIEVD